MDESNIVRDVCTLVEFAPTEVPPDTPPPPQVPVKLYKNKKNDKTPENGKVPTDKKMETMIRREFDTERDVGTSHDVEPDFLKRHDSVVGAKSKFDRNSSSSKGVYVVSGQESPSLQRSSSDGSNKQLNKSDSNHSQQRSSLFTMNHSSKTHMLYVGKKHPSSPSEDMSHVYRGLQAMVAVCSVLYCLILISIGIGFPLAHMIMFDSGKLDLNIYHGFHIYLYAIGILIQLLYLFKKLCDACEPKSPRLDLDFNFRAFGSKGFRFFSGMFGITTCLWLLIQFSWLMDSFREARLVCSGREIHLAVIAFALVYTILHLFIVFYNTKDNTQKQ